MALFGTWFSRTAIAVAMLLTAETALGQPRTGSMIDLGTLGGNSSDALGINAAGEVVGDSSTASGEFHAFLWQNGMSDLGTLGGLDSRATAINDAGRVVGGSRTASGAFHAFLWQDGVMSDLGTLGGDFSVAQGINAVGEVVGVSFLFGGFPHALLIKVAALQVDLVDPVPDLLDGAAVTTDPGRLAQAGALVRGAAADGVTRVVGRVRAPEAGTVELTLVDAAAPDEAGFLTQLGGAVGSSSVFVPTLEVPDRGSMAFALYQAPSHFVRAGSGDANERERQVSLRVRFTPQTGGASQEATIPITIARPPVVLVHGLWGSLESWNGFVPLMSDARFFVEPLDYSATNAAGFDRNTPLVGDQLSEVIGSYKAEEQVAAVQADVVTHSMGGLLVRGLPLLGGAYFRADNFQQGDVHKLINISSPHFGSELAARLRTKVNNFRCRAVFSAAGAPIHRGAIHDLSPGSEGLRELNGFVSPLPLHNNVGIASQRQKEDNASGALIGAVQSPLVCGRILPPGGFDALFRDDNDLLVSASSQRARLSPTSLAVSTFTPLIHTRAGGVFDVADGAAELESEEVSREVIELLNLPVDDAKFIRLPPP